MKIVIDIPDDDYKTMASLIEFHGIKALKERPQGEWEWEEEWLPSTTEHPRECQYAEWRCNQCHETPTDSDEWEDKWEKPRLRYCPNCGADMRGGKND